VRRALLVPVAVAILTPVLALSGCMASGRTLELADTVTENRSVELGSAKEVEVRLNASIGTFVIGGGASGLLDAEFTYNVAEWKPAVEYSESGAKGVLVIAQPDLKNVSIPDEAKNRWDIRLAGNLPLSIYLDAGVGDTHLRLAGVAVERLVIDQGLGAADVDLGQEISRDVSIEIDGGIGDTSISIPEGVGVKVDADMGLGSLTAPGLVKRGDTYVNDAYGEAEHTVHIRIDAGIGSVRITTHGGRAVNV
jgi:hypothetical protein